MFENMVEDIKMWQLPAEEGRIKRFLYLCTKQELHAVLIYRFGRWVLFRFRLPIIKTILKIIYEILNKASEMLIGVYIWPQADIGPGLKIEHFGSIIIGPKKMGSNCRVSSQVIIGHIGGFKGGGCPVIGDNVYIGAGAKVLGDIKIGNNVKIGANAVVITDVPDNAIAVGVPAKVKLPDKDTA